MEISQELGSAGVPLLDESRFRGVAEITFTSSVEREGERTEMVYLKEIDRAVLARRVLEHVLSHSDQLGTVTVIEGPAGRIFGQLSSSSGGLPPSSTYVIEFSIEGAKFE